MIVSWGPFAETFGPMKQVESQCLICHRDRVEKWVGGSKTDDAVTTDIHSDWIDTFTPVEHSHVWSPHTSYFRSHWFGARGIACGGIAAIPRIYESRRTLGEEKARKLAAQFHELVRGRSRNDNFKELHTFTTAVVKDPESLLQNDSPD